MILKVEKLDHQARGIAFHNNKPVFIENALPGEVVDIKIIKENKKIINAEVEKYIEFSNKRINSKCPFYQNCGGCDLFHISYEDELEYKENKIKEIMSKYASIENDKVKKIIGINLENYRNKATFHVNKKVGYYSKKSNEIIDIDKCLIVNDKINKILNKLKDIDLSNIYEIVVKSSINIENSMIVLKSNFDLNNDYYVEKLSDIVDTILIYKDKKYNIIYGNGFIFEKLKDYKFKISADSFFQVNTKVCEILYDKVLEYLGPNNNEKILDLYCGTGTIGIYISKYVKEVKGIEINEDAVKDANENKEINNISNIEFECMNANEISKNNERFDKIIVDPPRSGLDEKTINYLLNSYSKKIVYVSCDPMTLARDLKILSEKYEIKEITPVNMFTRTYHCENVTVLERK